MLLELDGRIAEVERKAERAIELSENFRASISTSPAKTEVENNTGVQIDKGKVCYISGFGTLYAEITEAIGNDASKLGVCFTLEDIADGDSGEVATLGMVENIDTSSYSVGDLLYLSPSSAGDMTSTLPTSSSHDTMPIAKVLVVDPSSGVLLFMPSCFTVDQGQLDNRYYTETEILAFGYVSSLQEAYEGGNSIALDSSNGDLQITCDSGEEPLTIYEADGSVVFNEGGNDSDFRVEGNSNANLLFLRASDDRIGIKTGSPGTDLDIAGQMRATYSANTSPAMVLRQQYDNSYVAGLRISGQNRATPTDFDNIDVFDVQQKSDSGTYRSTVKMNVAIEDVTDGSIDGQVKFQVKVNNTFKNAFQYGGAQGGIFNKDGAFDQRFATSGEDYLIFLDNSADMIGLGTNAPANLLDVVGDIGIKEGNELRFYDVGSSHYTGFEAPALSASQIYVLPAADGTADQVLKTDGSGNLSWTTVSGGSSNVEDGTAAGQMVFWDGASEYKHTEVTEVFWDDSNKRLGINDNAPAEALDVTGNINLTGVLKIDDIEILDYTTALLKIAEAGTINQIDFYCGATRQLRINTSGAVLYDGNSLYFYDGSSSNYSAFKAPASLSGDISFTLPDGDGSADQVLKTDGSANLDWASVAPDGADYLCLSAQTGLTAERYLAVSNGIKKTDAGAGSTLTLEIDSASGFNVAADCEHTLNSMAAYYGYTQAGGVWTVSYDIGYGYIKVVTTGIGAGDLGFHIDLPPYKRFAQQVYLREIGYYARGMSATSYVNNVELYKWNSNTGSRTLLSSDTTNRTSDGYYTLSTGIPWTVGEHDSLLMIIELYAASGKTMYIDGFHVEYDSA